MKEDVLNSVDKYIVGNHLDRLVPFKVLFTVMIIMMLPVVPVTLSSLVVEIKLVDPVGNWLWGASMLFSLFVMPLSLFLQMSLSQEELYAWYKRWFPNQVLNPRAVIHLIPHAEFLAKLDIGTKLKFVNGFQFEESYSNWEIVNFKNDSVLLKNATETKEVNLFHLFENYSLIS